MHARKTWVGLTSMALIGSVAIAGCGGGSSPAAATKSSSGGASATASTKFPPNLKGQTVRFAIGASPTVSDTTAYEMTQILKSWGATIHLYHTSGDTTSVRTVLSGSADVALVGTPAIINGGLMAFGPNQPHVDYFFVGAKPYKTLQSLSGHNFGVSKNLGGIGVQMLDAVLKNHHMPIKSIHLVIVGGSSSRVSAMLANQNKVAGTYVHSDGWLTLQKSGLNDIATVAKELPHLADSYMGAQSSWIQAHPALVQAVDEAWLEAAGVFQKHPNQWVAAAETYTKNAHSTSYVKADYQILKSANIWPDNGSGFSTADLQYNENTSKITRSKTKPPLSAWSTQTYWKAAVKQVLGK